MRLITIPLLLMHLLLAAISRGQAKPGASDPALAEHVSDHAWASDTIRPGKGYLLTRVLKPGLRQYLVYFQYPQKSRQLGFWYWMRDIAVETHQGVKTFAITQHWYGSDSASYRKVYSLNSMDDFAPIYHRETVGGKTSAYNWGGDGITGDDSLPGNSKKGFTLKFDEPNLNWNLDIETFEMLPLAAGKSFLINFYDAGLEPPKYVLYKVTGSEELRLMNGEKTDCWKLFTEGADAKGTTYSETYWISKKGHEFLKEADSFNGICRYKLKMPGTAPDLLPKFTSKD